MYFCTYQKIFWQVKFFFNFCYNMVKSSWLYARSFNATFSLCLLTRRLYYQWIYQHNILRAKDGFYSDSKCNYFYFSNQKCFQSLSSLHALYLLGFFFFSVIHCEGSSSYLWLSTAVSVIHFPISCIQLSQPCTMPNFYTDCCQKGHNYVSSKDVNQKLLSVT